MEAKGLIEIVKRYNKVKNTESIKGIYIYTGEASYKRNINENYLPNKDIVLSVETNI